MHYNHATIFRPSGVRFRSLVAHRAPRADLQQLHKVSSPDTCIAPKATFLCNCLELPAAGEFLLNRTGEIYPDSTEAPQPLRPIKSESPQ